MACTADLIRLGVEQKLKRRCSLPIPNRNALWPPFPSREPERQSSTGLVSGFFRSPGHCGIALSKAFELRAYELTSFLTPFSRRSDAIFLISFNVRHLHSPLRVNSSPASLGFRQTIRHDRNVRPASNVIVSLSGRSTEWETRTRAPASVRLWTVQSITDDGSKMNFAALSTRERKFFRRSDIMCLSVLQQLQRKHREVGTQLRQKIQIETIRKAPL